MKTKLLCVALLLGTTSMVRADEIADLKAATQKLAKQNQALAAKLAAVEKRQHKTEAKVDAKPVAVSADASVGNPAAGQWTAADLARHVINPSDDHSLTFFGVTLYGNIDGGVSYLSHGQPFNGSYGPGYNYAINKGSFNPSFVAGPNQLSNTAFGLKANQPLVPGISAVGQVEVQINPFSGQVQNGPDSLVENNGRGITAGVNPRISASGDSSKAGNLSQMWGGLSSPLYGTLTFGRQFNITQDQNNVYDPVPGGGNAFTLFGNSGTYSSGLQSTEDARLDNSFKYKNTFGPIRISADYKFDQKGGSGGGQVVQGGAGFDYQGFSFDATGGKAYNAINSISTPLSATNVTTLGGTSSIYGSQGNGLVNATISDNTAFELSAKYVVGPVKLFAGYQYVRFNNPSNPFAASSSNGAASNGYVEGGYGIFQLNANAYTVAKVVQTVWTGFQYSVRPDFDVAVGYYMPFQNSFYGYTYGGGGAGGVGTVTFTQGPNATNYGCTSSLHSNCSGYAQYASILFDYHLTKRFDIYAGAMYSVVHGGLAYGYAAGNTAGGPAGMIDPGAGLRYQF